MYVHHTDDSMDIAVPHMYTGRVSHIDPASEWPRLPKVSAVQSRPVTKSCRGFGLYLCTMLVAYEHFILISYIDVTRYLMYTLTFDPFLGSTYFTL